MAGEARDLTGVLLVGGAVTVGAGRRLRLGVVHLAGVTLQAVGRAERRGGVALVAGRGHRRYVHAGVARRTRVAVVRDLGDCVDTVVAGLTGRRRCGLPAVVWAAVRVVERGARLVTVEARLAVAGGADVRRLAVRERHSVAFDRIVPQMAALTAGRTRGRRRGRHGRARRGRHGRGSVGVTVGSPWASRSAWAWRSGRMGAASWPGKWHDQHCLPGKLLEVEVAVLLGAERIVERLVLVVTVHGTAKRHRAPSRRWPKQCLP